MARLATLIADHLKTIPAITAITGSGEGARILDQDYRAAGWNASPVPVIGPNGMILPVIVVDDTGAVPTPFSRMRMATEEAIGVWAFAPRTRQGADAVDTLMQEVYRELHRWQEPTTRRLMLWTMRLGQVPAEDGVYDRQDFRLAGIPAQGAHHG